MPNDPATSAEALQPANVTPTGPGPGYNYLSGRLIFVLALYLVLVTGFALYAMTELWPHPTPDGEPPPNDTTKTDTVKILVPTPEAIKARRARLCGADEKCGACVEREIQLQYESQRRYDPQCVRIFGFYTMTTTFVNDKQLTFVLPATSTAAPGKVDVVVVNARGATSEAKQIDVTA